MTSKKVFIPPLWQEVETSSGVKLSQVSSLVNAEIAKQTSDLVKTDGTRSMKANLDLDDYEIINPKVPESNNALASMITVRNHWNALNSVFDKTNINIFPVTGQICTASSQYLPWGSRSNPDNVFDNKLTSEWITGTAGKRSWVKVQLPNTIQICKVSFHPRNGHQKTTQIFTNY